MEEPELYIHPELQKKLLEIIRKFLPLHQIFITTHSPFYINSFDESLSIHEIKKSEGASNVKNVDSENITDVFSDLGLAPSDLLMYNGLILVEGKRDFKLLNNLLAEFLISNHLEIISIEGKNKLHFFADHKILSKLIKLGFKFLIILDRDEGNQKILDTLPDDALKDNILLLPVREIENLYINPELITSFLIEYLSIDHAESKLKGIIIESIDQIISMSLIDRVIRKSFLDKIPFQFHYRDKDELMNIECDNDEWLDNFYSYFQSKFWIKNFKTENYGKLFEETKNFYQSVDKQKKWKIFPGKNIRPLLFEKLKETLKISIPLEKLEELMKENQFVKEELLEKIINHFTI
ncbi:MAG: hypothetical protein CEE42_16555 [Promethearchaeota archaeon Loki_b31]|nr:MAG: hypothetical protein CEE42_16555 [Candidatus Lokiarchaeota archaeon Loki_b31]